MFRQRFAIACALICPRDWRLNGKKVAANGKKVAAEREEGGGSNGKKVAADEQVEEGGG